MVFGQHATSMLNNEQIASMQVVDAGFSFTHALPLFEGQLLLDGVRRINLGGKALTNFFKELVSYRWVCSVSVCTSGGVSNV